MWFRMLLYAGPSDPLEWLYAALWCGMGLWLLLPTHMFSVAPHVYRFVALVPQWVWGLAFLSLGLLQGRAWHLCLWRARHVLAMVGTMTFWIWGLLLFVGDMRAWTLLFYGILGVFQGLAAVWLYARPGAQG